MVIADISSTFYIHDALPGVLGVLSHQILMPLWIAYADFHFVVDEIQGHRGCVCLWLLESLFEVWT